MAIVFVPCILLGQQHEIPALPAVVDASHVEAGRQLFSELCTACHGTNGEGGRGPSLTEGFEVRRESDQDLANLIRKGIRGTAMPAFVLPESQVRDLVEFVRSLSLPAFITAVPGNPDSGREIFFGKGKCSGCHMIQGQGGFPGPDLSDIGATRTVAQLRSAVLQPSDRISDGFQSVTTVTSDGRTIRGVAKSYTNYSLAVLDTNGKLHILSTPEIKTVAFRDTSMMPGDYAARLTPEEIQNLLAFLSRQSIHRGSSQ